MEVLAPIIVLRLVPLCTLVAKFNFINVPMGIKYVPIFMIRIISGIRAVKLGHVFTHSFSSIFVLHIPLEILLQ